MYNVYVSVNVTKGRVWGESHLLETELVFLYCTDIRKKKKKHVQYN